MAALLRIRALLAISLALGAGAACGGEIIREQDAAGRVRVLREVGEDAAGNCVNNGLWQMLGPRGELAAEGRYDMGRRSGTWRRWIQAEDVPSGLADLVHGFEAPFVSEAPFVAGSMTGAWTIVDARGRRVMSVTLAEGVRQGELKCWSPAGNVIRQETYRDGQLNGAALAWNEEEHQLVHSATWMKGYRLVRGVALYENPATQKRCEGEYLVGPQTITAADDFWAARLAEYQYGNECLPHGEWRQWYASGQLAAEGRYDWGRPEGEFTWRHPNGQKAVVGSYAKGGLAASSWRWWNPEGAQVAARTIGAPVPAGPAELPTVQTAQRNAASDRTAVR